jgi:hypothetical protein
VVHPEAARGDDEVGRVVEQGLDHGAQLGRVVLAVGVQGDHVPGAEVGGQLVADAEGGTVAQVDRQHAGEHPGLEGHTGRVVGPPVHHHQSRHLEVADQRGHGLQHVADVGFLLVGGDDRHHRPEAEVGVALLEVGPGVVQGELVEGGCPLSLPRLGQGDPAVPLGGRH